MLLTVVQNGVPKDNGVLKALVGHNRLPVGDMDAFPPPGVYAVVSAPGGLRIGDEVVLK